MKDTVFWSWQNDLPSKTNREFIRQALSVAVDRVSQELDVEDVERVELDHDTKSSPGMVDIGQTILDKITKCAVMVADVTPISTSSKGKALPNPNVMIELGYGLHALGYERIIAILNTAYGAAVEDLPFDIRHRRILTYHLPENVDASIRKTVRENLTKQLTSAIQTNLTGLRDARSAAQPIDGVESHPNSPGIWKANWPIRIDGPFGQTVEIQPEFKPRAWLRIIPANYPNGIPPMTQLDRLPDEARLWAPTGAGNSGNFGACDFGYLAYWISGSDEDNMEFAINLAAFLEETGEIWFSDGTAFDERQGQTLISYSHLMTNWTRCLATGMTCLDSLGASKRRKVVIGINGMGDAKWPTQSGHVPGRSRKQGILVERTERDWTEEQRIGMLHHTWNKIRDAFGMDQMSDEEFRKYYSIRKRH